MEGKYHRKHSTLFPSLVLRSLYADQWIGAVLAAGGGFAAGALLVSLLSLFQRLYHTPASSLEAYFLPFILGGLGGLLMALNWQRLQHGLRLLEKSEEAYHQLLQTSPDGIGLCQDHHLLWMNPAGLVLLDLSDLDSLRHLPLENFIAPEELPRFSAYLEACQRRGSQAPAFWLEISLLQASGGYREIELAAVPLSFDFLSRPVLQLLLRDISQRKAVEHRLRQSAAVFESTHEAVLITDACGYVLELNQAFSRLTGYPREEMLNHGVEFLYSEQQGSEFFVEIWRALHVQNHWQGEVWNRRKNGEVYLQWQNISVVTDTAENIVSYVILFSDITHLRQSREQLNYLAYHDALTGLANRLLLQIRLAHALERATHHRRRLVVMWIDLDRFKLVNNLLGHAAADNLLKDVAQRLTGYLDKLDKEYTLARTGGDEFALVLEDMEETRGVALIAQRLLAELTWQVKSGPREAMITVSMGISIYPEDANDGEELLRMADDAMYRAKQQGGNTYQFYEVDMAARVLEHLKLENSLWQALERREFVLHYQPQIDLRDGRLIGAEALIRWQHPEEGLIYPGRFIQLAEESALIGPISDWALHTACMQNKYWQVQGLPPIRISVNLSARQIAQENIVEKVTGILHETRLEPCWLKLEVTESLIIENPELAIINLQALKKLGVTLSIDDFGTGYSSFSYLKEMPIDELKIDRSFVKDIPGNSNNCKITPAIIAIGHSLQLKVVAEGVETMPQLEFLKEHGCDAIQGYLFSHPVAADVLAGLFRLDFLRYAQAESVQDAGE